MQKLQSGAPFVLLAVSLIVTFALSGFVSADAWMDGEHVTPTQVALHDFYEAVGQHHHHARSHPADAFTVADDARSADGRVGLMWSVAAPDLAADPGQAAQYLVGWHRAVHLSLATLAHLPGVRSLRPPGLDAMVLDPPPRPVA